MARRIYATVSDEDFADLLARSKANRMPLAETLAAAAHAAAIGTFDVTAYIHYYNDVMDNENSNRIHAEPDFKRQD